MKIAAAIFLLVFLGTVSGSTEKQQRFSRAMLVQYGDSELKMICLPSNEEGILACAWASVWYIEATWRRCVPRKENNHINLLCEPGI